MTEITEQRFAMSPIAMMVAGEMMSVLKTLAHHPELTSGGYYDIFRITTFDDHPFPGVIIEWNSPERVCRATIHAGGEAEAEVYVVMADERFYREYGGFADIANGKKVAQWFLSEDPESHPE